MSLLDKLKDLVASLESEEEVREQDPEEVLEEEPSQDAPVEHEDIQEYSTFEEVPDYLECTEEESRIIFEDFQALKAVKQSLATLLLEYEIKKGQILSEIAEKDSQLMRDLNELRLEYGMPSEGISMQLPHTAEEKVAFVKD